MRQGAGQAVRLYAAGSLAAALTEVAEDFTAATGIPVETRFAPSGLLRQAIAAGAAVDVFASADMEHPGALARIFGGTVRAFAGNALCALVRPGLGVTPATLLERMLDPGIRLGISTPGADPSGDYALELFRRADALRPGAAAALESRALRLTGSTAAEQPARQRNAYAAILAAGGADLFLTYRTNALAARRDLPSLEIVDTPPELAVTAEYGLIVLGWSKPAHALADRILSTRGRGVLEGYGFSGARISERSGQGRRS